MKVLFSLAVCQDETGRFFVRPFCGDGSFAVSPVDGVLEGLAYIASTMEQTGQQVVAELERRQS
jgi:hypothetical protein